MSAPIPLPPFATVPQYEALTGATAPPGTADALAGASAAIRRYCGWHIAPVITASLTLDGPGTRILMLPTLRMVELTGITEYASGLGTAVYDLIPDVDLEWSINGTVRKRSGGWWTTALRGLLVDLDHGFAMEDVADLTQVVLNMVARAMSNPYGVTAQAVGGVSISSGPGPGGQVGGLVVFPEQAAQLETYRLERWP